MTCRRAAELISGELDAPLSLYRQVGIAFHTLACTKCRRYRRQTSAVEEAVGAYFGRSTAGHAASLPEPAKERLKEVVQDGLAGESGVER